MDRMTKLKRLALAARSMDINLSDYDIDDNGQLTRKDQNKRNNEVMTPTNPGVLDAKNGVNGKIVELITGVGVSSIWATVIELRSDLIQPVAITFFQNLAQPFVSPTIGRANLVWGVGGCQVGFPAESSPPTDGNPNFNLATVDIINGQTINIPCSFLRVAVRNESRVNNYRLNIGAFASLGVIPHYQKVQTTNYFTAAIINGGSQFFRIPRFATSARVIRGPTQSINVRLRRPDTLAIIEDVAVGANVHCPEIFLPGESELELGILNNGPADITNLEVVFYLSL